MLFSLKGQVQTISLILCGNTKNTPKKKRNSNYKMWLKIYSTIKIDSQLSKSAIYFSFA